MFYYIIMYHHKLFKTNMPIACIIIVCRVLIPYSYIVLKIKYPYNNNKNKVYLYDMVYWLVHSNKYISNNINKKYLALKIYYTFKILNK